jgi:hypothetical protein
VTGVQTCALPICPLRALWDTRGTTSSSPRVAAIEHRNRQLAVGDGLATLTAHQLQHAGLTTHPGHAVPLPHADDPEQHVVTLPINHPGTTEQVLVLIVPADPRITGWAADPNGKPTGDHPLLDIEVARRDVQADGWISSTAITAALLAALKPEGLAEN